MNNLFNLPRIEHELNTDKKMQSRKTESAKVQKQRRFPRFCSFLFL